MACPDNEAHRPGEPGCVPIGDACPADGFPADDDLPADLPKLFVRAGATGGEGTRLSPYATVNEAIAAAGGTTVVVVIAPGEYAEILHLEADVTLWGGCTGVILGPGVVVANTPQAAIHNATIVSGVEVRSGMASLRGVVFTPSPYPVIELYPGAALDAEDILVGAVEQHAVEVTIGSHAEFRRSVFMDNRVETFFVGGGDLTLRDCSVRTAATLIEDSSLLFAGSRSTITVERSFFDHGFLLFGEDSVLRMTDSTIVGLPTDTPVSGPGILAIDKASVDLARVSIIRPRDVGAAVGGAGTFEVQDVVIREVVPRAGAVAGHGIELADTATATLARVVVEEATAVGVLVDGAGTTLMASDLTVRGTRANVRGQLGRGMQVQSDAVVDITRMVLDANLEVGLMVSSRAVATVTHARVERTMQRACAAVSGCPGAGIGVGGYLGGSLRFERFRIGGHDLVGVQIARDGSVDLVDGEVFENPIGVNLQVSGYDVGRISERVFYRDNGVNLDASELVVPDPIPPSVGP